MVYTLFVFFVYNDRYIILRDSSTRTLLHHIFIISFVAVIVYCYEIVIGTANTVKRRYWHIFRRKISLISLYIFVFHIVSYIFVVSHQGKRLLFVCCIIHKSIVLVQSVPYLLSAIKYRHYRILYSIKLLVIINYALMTKKCSVKS